MIKNKIITAGALAALAVTTNAATTSVNFTEGAANQQLIATTIAGLDAQSNWNNTTGQSGTLAALNDSDGNATGASVTWSSGGMWRDGVATADANADVGDAQLAHGYLDDHSGGTPQEVVIGVTGISYTTYSLILYYSTDTDGDEYGAALVNGGSYNTTGTKSRYVNPNWNATNSFTVTGLSGDLNIEVSPRAGATRGSVAGFQIVDTTIPEPSSTALLGLGGLALIMRRKK